MRNSFVRAISEYADKDPSLIVLSGDMGFSVFETFEQDHPGQFLNVGIAEATMTSMACGLVMAGRKVITYSIATFVTARAFEQIRVDLCYQELPVIIVGVGGGFSYGTAGATHHATEDLSYMRCLPNMRIMTPIDGRHAYLAVLEALTDKSHIGPNYIRLGHNNEPPLIEQTSTAFAVEQRYGKAGPVALVSCGSISAIVEEARCELVDLGYPVQHIALGQIKPLPTEWLEDLASDVVIITIEENSVIGGFGSAIAEYMAEHRKNRIVRLGVRDRFHHLAYDQKNLHALEGISQKEIVSFYIQIYNQIK